MPESTELTYSYRAGIGTGRTSIDFYRGRVSMRPTIALDDCAAGCSACIDVCPTDALKRDAAGASRSASSTAASAAPARRSARRGPSASLRTKA